MLRKDDKFSLFKKAWDIIEKLIEEKPNPNLLSKGDIGIIIDNCNIITLILEDLSSYQDSCSDPFFDYFLTHDCLHKFFVWALTSGQFFDILKICQLRIYQVLLSNYHQKILIHKPILRPLLKLIKGCASLYGGCASRDVERRLVFVLNEISSIFHRERGLFDFYLALTSDSYKYLFVNTLISFVQREDEIGQLAKNSLLFYTCLSTIHEDLAYFIEQKSNFSEVSVASLACLYSNLPRRLQWPPNHPHNINKEAMLEIPGLLDTINFLQFLDVVVQKIHPKIREQLTNMLFQGFLKPVLGQCLLQEVKSDDLDEIITATAYLEIFLRYIRHPSMVKLFVMQFLLAPLSVLVTSSQSLNDFSTHSNQWATKHEEEDGDNYAYEKTDAADTCRLLDVILSRLDTPLSGEKLTLVTLSLLHTLLDYNCEDLMYYLFFRYLVGCDHLESAKDELDKFGTFTGKRDGNDEDTGQDCYHDYHAVAFNLFNLTPLFLSGLVGDKLINDQLVKNFQDDESSHAADAFSQQGTPVVNALSPQNLANDGVIADTSSTSFYAYLLDARRSVFTCRLACRTEDQSSQIINHTEQLPKESTHSSSMSSSDSYRRSNSRTLLTPTPNSHRRHHRHHRGCRNRVWRYSYTSTCPGRHTTSRLPPTLVPVQITLVTTSAEPSSNILPHRQPSTTTTAHISNFCQVPCGDDDGGSGIPKLYSPSPDYTTVSASTTTSSCSNSSVTDSTKKEQFTHLRSEPVKASSSDPTSVVRSPSCYSQLMAPSSDDTDHSCLNLGYEDVVGVLETRLDQFLLLSHQTNPSWPHPSSPNESLHSLPPPLSATTTRLQVRDLSVRLDKLCDSAFGKQRAVIKAQRPPSLPLPREHVHETGRDQSQRPDAESLNRTPHDTYESLPTAITTKTSKSCDIGPFLTTIFNLLERMLHNSVFLNLHLTALVSRLSCYPSPILQSLLLYSCNEQRVQLKPGVKNLYKVLKHVKERLETYSNSSEFQKSLHCLNLTSNFKPDKQSTTVPTPSRQHTNPYPPHHDVMPPPQPLGPHAGNSETPETSLNLPLLVRTAHTYLAMRERVFGVKLALFRYGAPIDPKTLRLSPAVVATAATAAPNNTSNVENRLSGTHKFSKKLFFHRSVPNKTEPRFPPTGTTKSVFVGKNGPTGPPHPDNSRRETTASSVNGTVPGIRPRNNAQDEHDGKHGRKVVIAVDDKTFDSSPEQSRRYEKNLHDLDVLPETIFAAPEYAKIFDTNSSTSTNSLTTNQKMVQLNPTRLQDMDNENNNYHFKEQTMSSQMHQGSDGDYDERAALFLSFLAKNTAYSALIFVEFLKELAAIALEHSLST